jgi:hypothetical protein
MEAKAVLKCALSLGCDAKAGYDSAMGDVRGALTVVVVAVVVALLPGNSVASSNAVEKNLQEDTQGRDRLVGCAKAPTKKRWAVALVDGVEKVAASVNKLRTGRLDRVHM